MIYEFDKISPSIHNSCFIAGSADIIGNVNIKEEASVWFNVVIRGDSNSITIGKGSNVQDNSTVHVDKGDFPTEIGEYVTIGHGAIIHGCKINKFCLIGMGAIILNGAEIGEYSIVGAGSLITENCKIPSGVLCLGSPARVIRVLTEEEKRSLELSAEHYIDLSHIYKV